VSYINEDMKANRRAIISEKKSVTEYRARPGIRV
jgi:hypothetical protein